LVTQTEQKIYDTHDARKLARITELKSLLEKKLVVAEDQITTDAVARFAVPVASFSDPSSLGWQNYITAWEQDTRRRLATSLNAIVKTRRDWVQHGCGVGLPGTLLTELLHHSKWAAEKCNQFSGRDGLLNEMQQKLLLPNRINSGFSSSRSKRKLWAAKRATSLNPRRDLKNSEIGSEQVDPKEESDDTKGHFDGLSYAIIGLSGSGKTSLMAKLAAIMVEYEQSGNNVDDFGTKIPPRPIIVRFCGTSAGSHSALSLVAGLISQLEHLFGLVGSRRLSWNRRGSSSPGRGNDSPVGAHSPIKASSEPIIDYDIAVARLHQLLHDYPVILLIDSIDQLSDDYFARSRISFLDGVVPHPHTRIVISALPDERDPVTGRWIYCYQCHTRCKESAVPIVNVCAFATSRNSVQTGSPGNEFQSVMSKLLYARGRTLTQKQWATVLAAAEPEPSALYANLVARVVELWHSFDEDLGLTPTVKGLLNQIFDDMERQFGLVLTKTALGLITFSVSGLTDNEIEDLLSMDDNVLNSVFQYAKSNVRRLPSHVWLRLRGAMRGLLVERTGGCLGWYHRQLQETAMLRYSTDERKHLHSLMGMHFADLIPAETRLARHIASQPLTFTPVNVFFAATTESKHVHVNLRRVTESLHHLVESEMYEQFISQIRNVEIVFAAIKWGNPFQLISYLSTIEAALALAPTKTASDGSASLRMYADHYLRWFQLDMTAIVAEPERALFSTVTGEQCRTNYVTWCNRLIIFLLMFQAISR
jgi:energy-coupling factor transporter ATP-binding protein EcfA2